MSKVLEMWQDMREAQRQERAERLASASDKDWEKHTEHHWCRMVLGKKLSYWPSSGKYQYAGKMYYHFNSLPPAIKNGLGGSQDART